MRSRFDEQLADLNKKLIEMGAMCEECISLAAKALKEGNPEIRWEVEPLDNSLDGKYIFLPCLSPYTDRKKRIVLIKKTFCCSFFNEQLEGLYLIISRTFFCIHSQNKH